MSFRKQRCLYMLHITAEEQKDSEITHYIFRAVGAAIIIAYPLCPLYPPAVARTPEMFQLHFKLKIKRIKTDGSRAFLVLIMEILTET